MSENKKVLNGHLEKTPCPHYLKYKSLETPAKLQTDFVYPDKPPKCTWVREKSQQPPNPHTVRPFHERPKVAFNILEAIGMTPLVRLNRIPQSMGVKCQVYAKCEFLNPAGSVKDRISYRMLLDAEEKGIVKPGCTIIEPTSGNTGIGLSMACAVRGYRCIIVLPEKNSDEKVNVMKAFGTEVIRTPDADCDAPDSFFAVAQRLQQEIPDSVILNQYVNASNPLALYDGVAAEILYQLDGKVDMVVMGAGTGGTVTGIGRRFKEECPSCKIVAVDPEGSTMAQPMSLNKSRTKGYEVEGIGHTFIPTVTDRDVVDKWIKTNDRLAFPMAKRLICEEGFLCGGSSGAAMAAAMEAARELSKDDVCVIICPDNVRNYMSKFLVDNWMEARGHKDSINVHCHAWWSVKISNLIGNDSPMTVAETVVCREVLEKLRASHLQQMAVTDLHGGFKGMATVNHIMGKILDRSLSFDDPISRGLFAKFIKVAMDTTVGRLSRILEMEPYVVVVQKREIPVDAATKDVDEVVAVLTKMDMLNFIEKFSECKNKTFDVE